MACVLPVFFGISQCLIVVRVAIANEFGQSRGSRSRPSGSSRAISFAMPSFFNSTHDKVASDYVERPEEHRLTALPHGCPTPSPEPSALEQL